MRPQNRTVEQEVARVASGAHGTATRPELLAAGVTRAELKRRIRNGALIREYPGVYRVGHRAPSVEARYMAAVKACGEGALLSGRAAAWLQGLVKGDPPPPEVTARTERRIKGIHTRRSPRICEQASVWRGVPVTRVPQTLIDLAGSLSLDDLARACHEAGVKHGIKPHQVDALLAPNVRGADKLRAVLDGDAPVLLSRLEKRFRKLLRGDGLPLPLTNRPAGGKYVDCRWP